MFSLDTKVFPAIRILFRSIYIQYETLFIFFFFAVLVSMGDYLSIYRTHAKT